MIASIEELKEFHLLLHNLTLSKNRIIEKLKSYEGSSLQLGPAKETFDHNMFALNQGRFSWQKLINVILDHRGRERANKFANLYTTEIRNN